MKILLCASKTPDTTTKINFSADKKSLDTAGVTFILNPYDDHALAFAMNIKEKHNAELTVIHVGDASSEAIIRKCLSVGADNAIRVNVEPKDSYTVANEIANAVQGEKFDIIITGRESIDFNGSQVCDILSELLNIPSVGFVTSLDVDGDKVQLGRFIDGGSEKLSAPMPLAISCTKELAEPRIPNMRGIMAARTKAIKVVEPVTQGTLVELVSFENPAPKGQVVLIDAQEAEKLIEILHTKEKMI